MPGKNGFGNSRVPMTKKVSYGSALHYKNPILLKGRRHEKKMHKIERRETLADINAGGDRRNLAMGGY